MFRYVYQHVFFQYLSTLYCTKVACMLDIFDRLWKLETRLD